MDPHKQPMNELLDARFGRVEKALETLIKSISTYNPSPNTANDLVTADAELNQGLQYLHTHQTNNQRLAALRNLSSTLDSTIKDTLLLLTTTRAEILATPGTKFLESTPTHPVSYSELLSYARRISKTTLPHTYREPVSSSSAVASPKDGGGIETNGHTPITGPNGQETTTTTASTTGASSAIIEADKPLSASPSAIQQDPSSRTALPEQFKQAVSLPDTVFTPWPHDQLLRRGALATIQQLQERGEKIEGYDPEKSRLLEEEQKRKLEAEEAEAEERERERERERARRMSVVGVGAGGGGGTAVPKKKQFELETFDSDDED